MKITWTSNAYSDMVSIRRYLLEHADSEIMHREAERIAKAVDRLARFPGSGRPGRTPNTREVVVPPHIIPYRVRGDEVQILNVFHSSRKTTAFLP